MGKRKPKEQVQQLYKHLIDISSATWPDGTNGHALSLVKPGQGLLRMKRFRFQLMCHWLAEHLTPRRSADVGGGKGLLAYLLQERGWQVTVIDPVYQDLPDKYKDIVSGKRVRLPSTASVPYLDAEFEPSMCGDFDLIVGMHSHGCNVKIIDGAKAFGCEFILVPCCVIDEPLYPRQGVHWLECLVDYAIRQEFAVYPFQLHFKGQNIGFYARPNRP
jgi:hypothetical protein